MSTQRKSLKDRAKEFSVQLPFMDGREKGDAKELVGQVSTITDYGFLAGEDGREYVAFITKERTKTFYFGGTVLTDQMQQLEAEGYREEIITEGLPMLMTEKKSKNNRSYINVEFYPE
ncbi:MAG: hypothetical protein UIM53_05675 [Acutalibacteraceae bacterium]|nr:hypothetical protein [Acutalibacteraceae bacterium]